MNTWSVSFPLVKFHSSDHHLCHRCLHLHGPGVEGTKICNATHTALAHDDTIHHPSRNRAGRIRNTSNCRARFPSRSVCIDRQYKGGSASACVSKARPRPAPHVIHRLRILHFIRCILALIYATSPPDIPSKMSPPQKWSRARPTGMVRRPRGSPDVVNPHVHPPGSRKAVQTHALFLSEVVTLNIGRRCDNKAAGRWAVALAGRRREG